MTARLALLVLLAALWGCAGPQPPIVDMTGHDQQTVNRDLAWCYQHQPFIAAGNPITTCMQNKGYRILQGF